MAEVRGPDGPLISATIGAGHEPIGTAPRHAALKKKAPRDRGAFFFGWMPARYAVETA